MSNMKASEGLVAALLYGAVVWAAMFGVMYLILSL